jgi:hypothetical protein
MIGRSSSARAVIGSGVAKKKKSSSARLDREITKALGKKSHLWQVPEKKPRSRPAETATKTAEAAKTEKVCRYCGQKLHWSDGHFECGGEGAGVCSFWSAIGDYDRAGRPKDVESWLDGWIQRELGTDWAGMGWDRGAHARAIRDYFKLSAPTQGPQGTAHATKASLRQPIYTVIVWSNGDPTIVARDLTNREAALALGEKHQADVVENLGDIDEQTIRIQK